MSTQLMRHREELQKLAYPAVQQFIDRHPQYAIATDQMGSNSNTNYVILGQRNQEPVVFKYFCADERKEREIYALRHFAHTNMVPQLLAEDGPRLIVQSYIPGSWLPQPTDAEYAHIDQFQVGYTLGQAVATLTSVTLPTQATQVFEARFYEGMALTQYISEIIDASRHIHHNIEAYSGPIFAQSLANIEANLTYLLSQKRILYHQDALNHHFVGSRFSGFFDLEMCRVGTTAMQIGSLWNVFATHNNWPAFAKGFQEISDTTLHVTDFYAAKAFAHFLIWRYISRYGRWRGEIADVQLYPNIINQAKSYASQIEFANQVKHGD